MYTIFNSKVLWAGTDLKKFNEIRDVLENNKIKYKYKVKNRLGDWSGRGTIRGNVGAAGLQSEYSNEYEILVQNEEYEKAKHIMNYQMLYIYAFDLDSGVRGDAAELLCDHYTKMAEIVLRKLTYDTDSLV